MSYPDPPPPHQPFPGGFPHPMMMDAQNHDAAMDFDPAYPHKRARNFEQNLAPPAPVNRVNPPHLPGTKGIGPGHMFYKTRICAKFMHGTCPNVSSNCSFAHGHEDLREPPPNWQDFVRDKDRDRGSGSDTNVGDDRFPRMKVCKRYYNGDECPYGDRCNFVHERPYPPRVEGRHVPGRRESSIVGNNTGNVRFEGDELGRRETTFISIGTTENAKNSGGEGDHQQKMAYWKTKMCAKWEIGQCMYGDNCHYAHGASDLKVFDARAEAEPPMKSVPVPVPVYHHSTAVPSIPPANLPTAANVGEGKKKLNWKEGKKINRIYGDWLDDGSPPRYTPDEA